MQPLRLDVCTPSDDAQSQFILPRLSSGLRAAGANGERICMVSTFVNTTLAAPGGGTGRCIGTMDLKCTSVLGMG